MEQTKKPLVFILSTGGTIASKPTSPTATTGYHETAFCARDLIDCIPGIREEFDLEAEEVFSVDSSVLEDSHLLTLAHKANKILARPEVDGLVITHGTDTMEETAFFLNLTVKSKKPVVLTGSMRPTTVLSADGPMNLLCAIRAAGDKNSIGKGVMIAFSDRLWPARDATKVSTYHTDAFHCPENGPLGTVIDKVRYYYTSTRPHTVHSEFDVSNLESLPRVQIVYNHINTEDTMLKSALASGCDGIVLAGVGNGTLPPVIREALQNRSEDAPLIVRASRVVSGFVSPTGSFSDREEGILPSGGFSPQKARILLQLALTKTRDYETLYEIFDRY